MRVLKATLRWLVPAAGAVVIAVALAVAVISRPYWLPWTNRSLAGQDTGVDARHLDHGEDDHQHRHDAPHGQEHELAGDHGHQHPGHDEASSIAISPEAARNIGLQTVRVTLQSFQRTISVPAMVVERPGRSQINVTAPLGGRVERIWRVEGEAVLPGQALFDLRLTHEELVKAQSEFLRTAEELQVVQREIQRLRSITVPGAIPGKTIRERQYEQQKLEAVFNAQRQSLLLHGLTEEQVDQILQTHTLLRGLTVVAPEHPPNGKSHSEGHPFHVQQLHVDQGQYVDAGDTLCVLADHFELFIEGKAFEEDMPHIVGAATRGWPLTAVVTAGNQRQLVRNLKILYLSDVVDLYSRAFHFYVLLPNHIDQDVTTGEGHRFVSWRFKPGQRMELRVPVERWERRIVLPVDAVVREGAESFVIVRNGDHFDRVPVHVEYQGPDQAVIASDDKLVGETVVTAGAYQLHLAIKNKAGGGADPHAGHGH